MLYHTALPNRGILKITGKDRDTFLQGLITNDINKITSEQAIYTALLSPQGKFQYDLFIVAAHVNGEDVWLVECDYNRADMLLKRLSLYKLRSDVRIENVSDHFMVFSSWGSNALVLFNFPSQPGVAKTVEEGITFADPRLVELGIRAIIHDVKSQDYFENSNKLTPFEAYNLHRLKLGIPSPEDIMIDRGIPLECGFDELHAIDWDKGCYMGQELTARTRYRGLVRKRLLPVCVEGQAPSYQTPIFQENLEVGEIRTTQDNYGIAMIRLEALAKSLPFYCGSATLVPYVPHWMNLPQVVEEK